MNSAEEWILQHKGEIEKAVGMVGQGCEALASTVGKIHPVLEAVFLVSAKILDCPKSEEASYLQGQLQSLDRALTGIQDETRSIAREMQRASMNKQNFDYEAQVISQYEKFRDFLEARAEFREKSMEKFLVHFENLGGDLNLEALYNAVTGATGSGEPLLDTVVAVEQRSRRAVEKFCAGLKRLFVAGAVAIMAHAALRKRKGAVGQELLNTWQERLADVEERARAAVDDCARNFAKQAKVDVEQRLLAEEGVAVARLAHLLLAFLAEKYDWVTWSVSAVIHRGAFPWRCMAGKEYYGHGGSPDNFFDVLSRNSVMVLVSFSVEPRPIDKTRLWEQIQQRRLSGKMAAVARLLGDGLPECVVRAVSRYKEVAECNSFPEDCYFYEKHRRAYLCVHSK
ncbi:hypothetical protein AAFF_G00169890 [Aldrovandia affinis]|uniref:Uncharacterized protein n=1 Tax=Aldrovandia affinis TaxID=143900 RepID=A0AAD7W890_9TELE|nr:hypothetical protein AAFF_G00169890 [Aldrovandia affinis]